MTKPSDPQWLRWARELQSIAQNGLHFTKEPYDRQRYEALRDIAAEMMAAGSDHPLESITGLFSSQAGYATPKVDVRGVVFRADKILLVRERTDGKWTLPGGWADLCAAPAENVVREIFEESGFATRATKLLAVFDRSRHPHTPPFPFHVYKMFFHCAIIGGEAQPSSETDRVEFFGENELPELSLTRVTPWQISRAFEHHRQPDLATDFDH